MKMRIEPCGCITRFLNRFPRSHIENLNGLNYEDETCYVECRDGVIKAQSYEMVNGKKYKDSECVMAIW